MSGDGGAAATGRPQSGCPASLFHPLNGWFGDVLVSAMAGEAMIRTTAFEVIGASVRVNNGALTMTGVAGGTLGIGVISTNNSGDILSLGTGSVSIAGTGVNAGE